LELHLLVFLPTSLPVMTRGLQSGVLPSVPGVMAVGALPVGPINLSDDDPEDKDRSKLSEGIQNNMLNCIAECSDPIHWCDCQRANGSPPAASGNLHGK
jgi:hypothetical protein